MSFYSLGVHSGAVAIHPALAHASNRALDMGSGFSMVRTGEKRFYNRGIHGVEVGANSPGVVGTLVDTVVGLILDVGHVLLLLGGMLLLWRGLVG